MFFLVLEFSFPVMLEENKISFCVLLNCICVFVCVRDSQLVVKSIGEGCLLWHNARTTWR